MLRSPWELGALPSKAPPLFWGRTELRLSGGVSPSKSQQPGHHSQTNLLCSQTPVISKAMSPRSPAISANPGLRRGWPTSLIRVGTSVSLPFTLSDLSLGDHPGPGTVCHAPSTTTQSTAGLGNLCWHHKREVFCYYFVYLFSLRRRQREIRSVCSKTCFLCDCFDRSFMGIKTYCKTVENSIFITFRNSLVGFQSLCSLLRYSHLLWSSREE